MYRYKLTEIGDDSVKEFQQERIDGFNRINDLFAQLFPLIKDAKQETIKYYQENDTSYEVVYSTDLAADYIQDMINLFKPDQK